MSANDDAASDTTDDSTDPSVTFGPDQNVDFSIRSLSSPNGINTSWSDFLSSSQANIGSPSYDATSDTYNLSASDRFHQMKFTSLKGADALVDEETVMVILDPSSVPKSKLSISDTLDMFSSQINTFDQLMQDVLSAIPNIAALSINVNARNACWLMPGNTVQIVTQFHFSFDIQTALDAMKKALGDHFGFSLSIDPSRWEILATQTILGTPKDDDPTKFDVATALDLTLKIPISGFIFWLSHSLGDTELTLTEDPTSKSTDGLFSRLSTLGSDVPDSASADPTTAWSDAFPTLHLWSATVGKDDSDSLWWRLRLLLIFCPEHNNTNQYLVGISYDSSVKTLSGALLFTSAFPDDSQRKLPTYDPRNEPPATLSTSNLEDGYNIVKFFSDTSSAPAGLPTQIIEAFLTINFGDKKAIPPTTTNYSLALTAITPPSSSGSTTQDDPAKVPAPFDWDKISLSAQREGNNTTLELFTSFTLNPKDPTKYSSATLWVDLKKTNKIWEFTGHAYNLQFGAMIEYFEEDFQNPILEVLGKFTINSLDVDYTFNSEKAASSFLMHGTVTLGQLELIFLYQYARSDETNPAASKPEKQKLLSDNGIEQLEVTEKAGKPRSDWSFEAVLGASTDGATIGSIADSIIDGASSKLPDFVKDIEVKPASTGKGAVYLRLSKGTDPTGTIKQAIFTMIITISAFQITFVQISSGDGKAKQLLRASVDPIPVIRDIPLLDELPQPFDKLAYHWVRDANGSGGFTQSELDAINTTFSTEDKVLYKASKSKKSEGDGVVVPAGGDASSEPEPAVMAVGHHFLVIDDGKAIVDHNFNNAKTKPKDPDGKPPAGQDNLPQTDGDAPAKETEDTHDPPDTTVDAPPSKGDVKKSTKFLSIDSFGLQFKDGVLWIMVDATITLGPVSLSLLGFGIGVPMSQLKLNKISSLTGKDLDNLIESIQWQIHGLAIAFEKPPLIMAGVFEHETVLMPDNSSKESYRGGIAITFPPYVLVAVGEYSIITKNNSPYKSIFVYAKLDGPLVELEFGRISGVRLGFGYNSAVRSPSVEELTQFPFVCDQGAGNAGNNPRKILDSMTKSGPSGQDPWVDAKQDAYWFAIGMTITACEVLSVTAVAMLGFKDSGIVVSIFADAIAQLPAAGGPREASILYVELTMMAEMNFGEGYFRVEAALAPTSFLLVPQCQLYGGFALCYWFGRNEHAGDFVFTVGGYHPAYKPPAWYPVVKRLGFSFTLGDLSVTGEGYFAITPQVAMGGAMLHVSLSVGPVSAYLDASFDAMINFSPLHYIADMKISVGVECDIDFLFVHIHISCHVSADLHIEGPEFGGKAHVDFYLFGFDIYFGQTNQIPPPISLGDFYDIVRKLGPEQGVQAQSDPNSTKYSDPFMNRIKFSLEDGAFIMPQRDSAHPVSTDSHQANSNPSPNTGANTIWNVKGGTFQFRISCDIAISEASINYAHRADPTPAPTPTPASPGNTAPAPDPQSVPNPPPLFDTIPIVADPDKPLNPVYARPMQLSSSNKDKPITSTLTVTILSHDGKAVPNFQIQYLRKSVPASVWGDYSRGSDPNHASARDVCKSDTTVELAMGLVLHSPPPRLEKGKIPAFNATLAARLEVPMGVHRDSSGAQVVDHWILPDTEDEQVGGLPSLFDKAEVVKSPEDQWEDMRKTWNGAFEKDLVDGQDGMLDVFCNVFGWNEALVGGVPEVLVGAKQDEGLVQYYLALPRLSDGVQSTVGDASAS